MKTKVLTFVLLLNFLYSTAQVVTNIGIKGGLSFATMTYNFETVGIVGTYDYKTGVYTALTAELFKGKFLSLTTDLGFVQKGMKQKIPVTSPEFPDGNGDYRIWKIARNYVSFSPMLKGFYSFNKLTTYALLGPRLDLTVTDSQLPYSTMQSKTHKFILGFNYGAGAEYKIGKFAILLECMGHPNLTPVMDQESLDGNSSLKVTGNAYIVTAGLKYCLH
jgi:hypothetical protein